VAFLFILSSQTSLLAGLSPQQGPAKSSAMSGGMELLTGGKGWDPAESSRPRALPPASPLRHVSSRRT